MARSNFNSVYLGKRKDNCGIHAKWLLCERTANLWFAIAAMNVIACKYSPKTVISSKRLLSGECCAQQRPGFIFCPFQLMPHVRRFLGTSTLWLVWLLRIKGTLLQLTVFRRPFLSYRRMVNWFVGLIAATTCESRQILPLVVST